MLLHCEEEVYLQDVVKPVPACIVKKTEHE